MPPPVAVPIETSHGRVFGALPNAKRQYAPERIPMEPAITMAGPNVAVSRKQGPTQRQIFGALPDGEFPFMPLSAGGHDSTVIANRSENPKNVFGPLPMSDVFNEVHGRSWSPLRQHWREYYTVNNGNERSLFDSGMETLRPGTPERKVQFDIANAVKDLDTPEKELDGRPQMQVGGSLPDSALNQDVFKAIEALPFADPSKIAQSDSLALHSISSTDFSIGSDLRVNSAPLPRNPYVLTPPNDSWLPNDAPAPAVKGPVTYARKPTQLFGPLPNTDSHGVPNVYSFS